MGQSRNIREDLTNAVLKAIRARHWTQAQAARHLETSQSRISDLKRVAVPTEQLIDWLAALGLVVSFTTELASPERLQLVDERYRMLEEARAFLRDGKPHEAMMRCRSLEWKYPNFRELRPVMYDALMQCNLPIFASDYRPLIEVSEDIANPDNVLTAI